MRFRPGSGTTQISTYGDKCADTAVVTVTPAHHSTDCDVSTRLLNVFSCQRTDTLYGVTCHRSILTFQYSFRTLPTLANVRQTVASQTLLHLRIYSCHSHKVWQSPSFCFSASLSVATTVTRHTSRKQWRASRKVSKSCSGLSRG